MIVLSTQVYVVCTFVIFTFERVEEPVDVTV